MPKANWGISAGDVDDFDRDSQYKPFIGDPPPSGVVYIWRIKRLVAVAPTEDKVGQLRVGLELVPQGRSQAKYKGYYQTAFLHISDTAAFRYVPFLDALGVSGRDFTSRTIHDEQGNVQKIGAWRNDGNQLIAARLDDNDPEFAHKNPKKIGWMGEAPEDVEDSDVDDDESDVDFDDEEEEAPKVTSRRHSNGRSTKRSGRRSATSTSNGRTSRRRKSTSDDDMWEED